MLSKNQNESHLLGYESHLLGYVSKWRTKSCWSKSEEILKEADKLKAYLDHEMITTRIETHAL